jgi:hypothetical protein
VASRHELLVDDTEHADALLEACLDGVCAPLERVTGRQQSPLRAEVRAQIEALAVSYREMGHTPGEAMEAAVRHFEAEPGESRLRATTQPPGPSETVAARCGWALLAGVAGACVGSLTALLLGALVPMVGELERELWGLVPWVSALLGAVSWSLKARVPRFAAASAGLSAAGLLGFAGLKAVAEPDWASAMLRSLPVLLLVVGALSAAGGIIGGAVALTCAAMRRARNRAVERHAYASSDTESD